MSNAGGKGVFEYCLYATISEKDNPSRGLPYYQLQVPTAQKNLLVHRTVTYLNEGQNSQRCLSGH